MERAVSQPNHTYLLIIVAFGSPPAPAGLACARSPTDEPAPGSF